MEFKKVKVDSVKIVQGGVAFRKTHIGSSQNGPEWVNSPFMVYDGTALEGARGLRGTIWLSVYLHTHLTPYSFSANQACGSEGGACGG